MLSSCPPSQTLSDYLAGKLESREADALEEHLQFCPHCIDRVEMVPGSHDTLLRAVRWSLSGDALADEPELAEALGAVQLLQTSSSGIAEPRAAGDAPATPLVRDYQLIEKLGEGGMGTVYRAIHMRLEKTVAIKVLRPDRRQQTQAVQRFEREMRALGSLEHPHIVRALDAGEDQGIHFLVMEFIEGVDLGKLVNRLGPLSVPDACEIARQAALGLAHAHRHEKVHRDVKPGNLMLSTEGIVRVLDLGLAQLRTPLAGNDALTCDDQVLGTRAYMSPEQLMGAKNVTAATDVYSLGVTLYQFLVGRLPLKPGQFALQLPPVEQLRPGVPEPVRLIMQAMLSRMPEDRAASMAAVAEHLQPHAAGANLSNLLRRFSRLDLEGAAIENRNPAGAASDGVSLAALAATEPFHTTDRAPTEPPPLPPPPPVVERANGGCEGFPLLWIAATGLACFALLAIASMPFWPGTSTVGGGSQDPPGDKAPPPPPEPGVLTFQVGDPPDLLLREVMKGTGIYAVPVAARDSTAGIRLTEGENRLVAGEYRLESSAWMLAFEVNGRSASATLAVKPERELFVRGMVRTDFPWHLPKLPPAQGAFAEATGKLWRAVAGGAGKELAYKLRLTMLNEVLVADVPHRWLRVEVTTTGDNYVETGYLLLDAALYGDQRQLRVDRGWIEARMPALQDQLASLHPDEKPQALVVRFDPRRDALAELAAKRKLVFPADRVSVQEAMALLFEADFAGELPQAVKKLRAMLAADRKLHFESINGTFGGEDCLVIRSEVPALKVSYVLARAKDVPFSFVKIDVQSPMFRGDFHLKDYQSQPAAGPGKPVDEESLRAAAALFEGTSEQQRFDVVSLPKEAGAKVRYEGSLLAPPQFFARRSKERESVTIDFEVELRVGAAETIDGALQRPLEVTIASGARGAEKSIERARLLLDEQRYCKDSHFVAHAARSFVQIGGEVFPYAAKPAALVEKLHRLGRAPAAERIGVYDALSLLFAADPPAAMKFVALRSEIAKAIIKSGDERKSEQLKVKLFDGSEPWGELWQPPADTVTYRIHRTPKLPFGICRVFLIKAAPRFELTAEVKGFTVQDGLAFAESEAWWQSEEKRTAAKFAAIPADNFRLWKSQDGEVLAWGEYLADAYGKLALRDREGKTVVHKLADLSPDELPEMRVRVWVSRTAHTMRAEYFGRQVNLWTLQKVGSEKRQFDAQIFSPADVQWVSDREDALKILAKWRE